MDGGDTKSGLFAQHPGEGNGEGAPLIPTPHFPPFPGIQEMFSPFFPGFIPYFTFDNAGEGGRVPGHEELQLLVQITAGEVDVP